MGFPPDPPTLSGRLVRLEPLSPRHASDLAAAAEEDRRTYRFTVVPRASGVASYVGQQLERASAGAMMPFAQVRATDGRAVGCTALWDPRSWPGRDQLCAVEIGWT